jgi:nicotinate-nucleotide adenylyltransferase
MVRLAIADNPQFEVSTAEIERSGPTYTADTLEHLHERVPEADLWFILGSDALLDLPNWKDPHRILAQARLAVACRAPLAPERLAEVERLVPGVRSHTDFVPMPQVSVSSSELRQRLRAGVSTRYWLPAPVERYAVERGLYVRGE